MFRTVFRTAAPLAFKSAASTTRSTVLAPNFMRLYSDAVLTKDTVTARVIDVIRAFDKTHASSNIEGQTLFHKDLGLDSLDTVELLVAIEEEFDIEIPDKVADELKSVGETVDFIVSNPDSN